MDRQKLIAELTRDEGKKSFPYLDCCGKPWRQCTCAVKGKLTIGIGRNLDDTPLSSEEMGYLANNNISDAMQDLDNHLPWWVKLNEVRQRVLVNMCFNMGIGSLLGFKNMLSYAERGMFQESAIEMHNSKWAGQVGPRASRLIAMWISGEEPR